MSGSQHSKNLSVVPHYLKHFPIRCTPTIFPPKAQKSAKHMEYQKAEVFSADTSNCFPTGQLYVLNYLQIIKNIKKILNTQTAHCIYKSHRDEMQITL